MGRINLKQAVAAIEGALAHARKAGFSPMAVSIVDPGGHLIAFQREDTASLARFQVATGKATGALALGASSRVIADLAKARPDFFAGFVAAAPAGVIASPGGVIVVDDAGEVIGAIGVTGDTGDNDEAAALAGLAAAGLKAQ